MTTVTNPRIKAKLYHYAAHVTQVYDGDTFTVDVDLGLGLWRRGQVIRLWKVNAPEVRGASRAEGVRARDFVRGLIDDKDILLRTILDKRGTDRTEKFGRLLGEVLIDGVDGALVNLGELLLEQDMAAPLSESGSAVRAVGEAWAIPESVRCRYCGEVRPVDQQLMLVAACPNCLDDAYELTRV